MRALDAFETPALVLDRRRLRANVDRLDARLAAQRVTLRPHLKTAKATAIAEIATARHGGAITVSTLAEAEAFADAGTTDILYAAGIAPAKLERVAALLARGIDLKLITDSCEVAEAVAATGQALGCRFPVLIEIDCGDGRAGVAPDDPTVAEIAACLDGRAGAPGAELVGVLTHAGHAYRAHGGAAVAEIAEAERAAAVAAATVVRDHGHACPVVSVGSTPTALFGRSFTGVTEVRAGVYMFGDLMQAAIGTCAVDEIAVSVLTSVTGQHRERGHLVIDAGALALSSDHGATVDGRDPGYGLVCDLDGTPIAPELTVTRVYQEHGLVPVPSAELYDRLPPGTRLRVLPRHACLTAAMHPCYLVIDGDAVVCDVWDRIGGW